MRALTPKPRMVCMSVSSHSGVEASTNAIDTAPTVRRMLAAMTTGRAPTLSDKMPAMGFTMMAKMVAGTNTRPASKGESPIGPCTHNGTMSVMPINDANRQFCAMKLTR